MPACHTTLANLACGSGASGSHDCLNTAVLPGRRPLLSPRWLGALSRNCELGALPMKINAKFGDCLHCGRVVPTSEYFMLHDDVWRRVHDTNRGMMHLKCVEARLGRALRRPDFAVRARINRMMSHLNPPLRRRYNPSTLELRKGALDFVSLLAKHEDLLLQLLDRGLSVWRAAYWENELPEFRKPRRSIKPRCGSCVDE